MKPTEPLAPRPPEVPSDLTLREPPAELSDLELCFLDGVDLGGCNLKGTAFTDVIAEEGSWANASAERMSLRRVRLKRLRLTGVNLANAAICDAVFVDCRIDLASFRFARLERVSFESCRMEEADFYSAELSSVVFSDCNLGAATWAGATLTRSEMRGCNLAGAGNPERLRGVRMPWADVVASAGELAAAVGIVIVERG